MCITPLCKSPGVACMPLSMPLGAAVDFTIADCEIHCHNSVWHLLHMVRLIKAHKHHVKRQQPMEVYHPTKIRSGDPVSPVFADQLTACLATLLVNAHHPWKGWLRLFWASMHWVSFCYSCSDSEPHYTSGYILKLVTFILSGWIWLFSSRVCLCVWLFLISDSAYYGLKAWFNHIFQSRSVAGICFPHLWRIDEPCLCKEIWGAEYIKMILKQRFFSSPS